MSGTCTVRNTANWITPFEVEVAIDGRAPATATFATAAKAQVYAVNAADEHDLTLLYRIEGGGVTEREVQRICRKCREAKPISEFRSLTHQNRRTNRDRVHFGWAEKCLACEAEEVGASA